MRCRWRVRIVMAARPVELGEVFGDWTVLEAGSGLQRIRALCGLCKIECLVIAASLPRNNSRRCRNCQSEVATDWVALVKWKNPKPASTTELARWSLIPVARGPLREPKKPEDALTGFKNQTESDMVASYIEELSDQEYDDPLLLNAHCCHEKLEWYIDHLDAALLVESGCKTQYRRVLTEAQKVDYHCSRDYEERGTLTVDEWDAIRVAWRKRCAYCGVLCRPVVMEHVRPIRYYGRTRVDNIVPSCAQCNNSKSTKNIAEWLGEEKHRDFLVRHEAKLKLTHRLLRMKNGLGILQSKPQPTWE